jgi:hypothetical protein
VGDPTNYEVEIDCREGAVFLLVCRSIDGRRPPGYYMHDGRRTRAHLADVLDTGGELERSPPRDCVRPFMRRGPPR